MTFGRRESLKRAVELVGEAHLDLKRALDHEVGTYCWDAWQRQAQAKLLEVVASMDVGEWGLPHPWDLRTSDDEGRLADRAEGAMRRAMDMLVRMKRTGKG